MLAMLLAATPPPGAAAPSTRHVESVFVLDVELGPGVKGVDGTTVLESLLDAMRDRSAWKLVPQRDIALFIDNQRRAQILGKQSDCTTERCLAELAGALGGLVVRTHVGMAGDRVQVAVRVTSATSGVVASGTASSLPDAILDAVHAAGVACRDEWQRARGVGAVREAPHRDLAFEEPRQAGPASDADEAVVSFTSEPDGASVRVDGNLLCASTPCRKRVVVGAHEAVFEKERHAPSTRRFTAAKGVTVSAPLVPRFGWISVETAPPGIAITVDGQDAGRSPIPWREVEQGAVEIAVSDPCWARSGERVTVKAGERRAVKLAARPRRAGLRVIAEDARGNAVEGPVHVDGAEAGAAGETLSIPLCARRLSVPIGNELFEAELRLDERKVTTMTARPVPSGASVDGMIRVAGGSFTLGEDRRVNVATFLLDTTEVTVEAYLACLRAGRCGNPDTGPFCNWGKPDRASHPVNCLEWSQARAYCAWAGKRLPTEAEWEWAARAGSRGTEFPWGNASPDRQVCWNGGEVSRVARALGTCAVGSLPEGDSPLGVKDLAGNVAEWTEDDVAGQRVARGGGWSNEGRSVVSARYRQRLSPDDRRDDLGFRCARTP